MLKLVLSLALVSQIVYGAHISKRQTVTENEDFILICRHEPIDLGIVLDSSSSIRTKDFNKGLVFLQDFLRQFQIGDGRNDVRVSLILYGKGIYTDQAFNLTTYNNKEDVIKAVGEITHMAGRYTDTGKAIEYMHRVQLNPSVTRDYAEHVSVVLTDGNSQEWKFTGEASKEARDDGIKMFAVGVGNVRNEELLRIAGVQKRVIKVENYNDLKNIVKILANETCIKKPKPTTTPPPATACGVDNPADINFVFSPVDLGLDGVLWATSFMSLVLDNEDMETGFRFGAITGSCPDDKGFNLDRYDNIADIKDRLSEYERYRINDLVDRAAAHGFTAKNGGRDEARDVAVLIVREQDAEDIADQVDKLVKQGVQVFIAEPSGAEVHIEGAHTLAGPGALEAAQSFVSALCH